MKRFIQAYDQENRLKTFVMALITLLLSVLLVSLFASCVYDDYDIKTANSQGDTYLSLNFPISAPTETRAGLDDNPANPVSESSIHSIRIWAFNSQASSDDAIAIGYREEILSTPVNGENEVKTVSMKLPRSIAGSELKNLDLYILANAESIEDASDGAQGISEGNQGSFEGVTSKKLMTKKQLRNLVIKSQFGITSEGKPQASEVPSSGLPISRVITNISVADHVADTETEAYAKAVSIPLVRAVSKLHFFFARKKDAGTDEAFVSRIELDDDIIPTESYVFPDAATLTEKESAGLTSTRYGGETSYVNTKLLLDGVANKYISNVEDPTIYRRKENEKAPDYMERLSDANFISRNRTYLRESNKPITGKIYFKQSSDSPEQSVAFSIPSNRKPAARNHELVVYGYFTEGGKLMIEPTVLDWEDGGKYDYIDKVEIHTIVEGDYQTQDDRIQVAYNDPTFGPMFTFENIFTAGRKWALQSSNPNFGFVIAGDSSGEIKDYIQGNGYKESISFYVVPKYILDTTKPHEYEAEIFLTVGVSNKALINVGEGEEKLPGTSTEIHFIQVK